MSFEFTPYSQPFPEWHGPYSPARGDDWGFRVRGGLLMTVVATEDGQEEWVVRQAEGAELLQQIVRSHWGGGRVLLLPNGLVVKPNPDESDSHRFGDVQYASEEWGSSASEDESEEETDCDDESVEEDEEYLDANDEDNYDEEPAEVVIAPSPQPSQLVAQGAPQTSSVVDSRSADPRRSPPSPERLEAFASRGPSTANEAPTGFWGWLSGALRRKPR